MNSNKTLIEAGYKPRHDFPQIAQWAARQRFTSEAELLKAVSAQFGAVKIQHSIGMNETPAPWKMWQPGSTPIDRSAIDQIETALRLPVAVSGALMPDGHSGYSLPIGGVVALANAVSPAFVGYDISCRMRASIFTGSQMEPTQFLNKAPQNEILQHILASTSFGLGSVTSAKHPVMDDPAWKTIKPLAQYTQTAAMQLGSSGSGNHFADFLIGEVLVAHPSLPPVGSFFTALVTHSGSRGVGNKMGGYYAKLADIETKQRGFSAPEGYGWMSLDTQAGQEYWIVMELMARYAAANHEIIHDRFANALGEYPAIKLQNQHNFAAIESHGGHKMVVHRKGATPAGSGTIGIIPGSSGTDSYLVVGLGNPDSLNSASHGAGRPRSRTASKKLFDADAFKRKMSGITHVGIDTDESWSAYKDIESVMAAQRDLVTPIARLTPVVVVMGGNAPSDDGD